MSSESDSEASQPRFLDPCHMSVLQGRHATISGCPYNELFMNRDDVGWRWGRQHVHVPSTTVDLNDSEGMDSFMNAFLAALGSQ